MLLASALLLAAAAPAAPAPQPAPVRSTLRSCYLSVKGKVHVNGRCRVYPMGGHSYTLNSWDGGKPHRSHFAVVNETRPGRGEATWNRDPNDDRAGDPLGTVRWQRGCWVNPQVKICAR